MNAMTYERDITALLVVDRYNDFISEGGKLWPRIKAVAQANRGSPAPRRPSPLARATETSVRHAPGFISASLHRGLDGTKVTMYVERSHR
jgi:hypothetical protein